jgi:hypothetical protein
MSSASVRNAVLAAWPAHCVDLPLHETINKDLVKSLPPVWGTLSFVSNSRQHMTMGANPWIEERGTVMLVIAVPSGTGAADGATRAEAIMHAWDGWQDPSGDIEFLSVGAPQPIEMEAVGDWFLFGVTANYRAQERVQLP